MKIQQLVWDSSASKINAEHPDSQLILCFSNQTHDNFATIYEQCKQAWPKADIVVCSSAGDIVGTQLLDSASITAVEFDNTPINAQCKSIETTGSSLELGKSLAEALPKDDLKHVLILSDGHSINGAQLTEGLRTTLPDHVQISGGLAGDDTRFEKTTVQFNENNTEGNVVAIGLYGDAIKVSCGAQGGWQSFGPDRTITKSDSNVLFELDNKPALELYKEYLGDDANDLPGSALRFPLCIYDNDNEIVRTILSIDDDTQSMTFAGDMPEGKTARLMRCTYDSLIEGSERSIETAYQGFNSDSPMLLLAVSCVGRRIVLGQSTEDELDALADAVHDNTTITGFYSYGEIGPGSASATEFAQLHNQTMTVTAIQEV